LEFVADSDAHIVRGEIVLLQKLFSGQRAADVPEVRRRCFLQPLRLEHFLTPQRRNGLASMVQRIRAAATSIEKGGDVHAG
jgi:sulfur transfer protein SufE